MLETNQHMSYILQNILIFIYDFIVYLLLSVKKTNYFLQMIKKKEIKQ